VFRRILPEDAARAVERERELLARIRALCLRAPDGAAGADRVGELLAHLDEMFMLVVVGEVKAGKSAFVNALLRADVCPEGPTPLTDRVHVLGYADAPREVEVEPHVVRRDLPLETLREMHVVDTPGTNSPVPRHQAITERFLPRADIVFFVTSIDCPLTQTELDLLRDVRERYRKEVACVLTKIDMHPESDRPIVIHYLEDAFREHLGFQPPLFAVSARLAREAHRTGDAARLEASGFPAVERYVVENLSEPQRLMLKLRSPLGAALDVLAQLDASARSAEAVLDEDFAGWRALEEQAGFAGVSIAERAERHLTPVAVAFENLEARGRGFLREAFRLRRFRLLSDARRFREAFDRDVLRDAAAEVERKVDEAARWLGEETRALWERSLDFFRHKVAAARYGDRILAGKDPDFRATRRETLLGICAEARRQLEGYSPEGECARVRDEASRGLRAFAGAEAAAAGLGGAVAALLAPGALFGLGLALAAGVALSGFLVLPARRQRAIESFEAGVRRTRDAVLGAVRSAFAAEAERAASAVLDAFAPFRDFYEARRRAYAAVREEAAALRREVQALQSDLG
jgi:GTP-binding protein EngB required for normal cell division